MGQIVARGFHFQGHIDSSKSMMNRALIIQSFAPELKLIGDSSADDVVLMRDGLRQLLSGSSEPINCGHAGTVLRFLALRASRIPGFHRLTGSERLFARPQDELMPIFGQLGIDAKLTPTELQIRSQGWRLLVDGVQVNATRSSQFASGLLLSAWDLPFSMHMSLSQKFVSEGYWRMTVEMVKAAGMALQDRGREVFIPAGCRVRSSRLVCEPDLSSAFAVAALAVVDGVAILEDFPQKSLQPDRVFLSILKDMGVPISWEGNALCIRQAKSLNGITVDIENSPDLFPVLAVLCGLARSESYITGVGHLRYKESSRLDKSRELLRIMGADIVVDDQRAVIKPVPLERRLDLLKVGRPGVYQEVTFDVDHDHRMAMAAEVARRAGVSLRISDPGVVNKSFPKYFEISGGSS